MADTPPQVAVIVAHPDDETLWCGGLILQHPEWRWHILTLCRGSDPDRGPKFRRVLERLNADGAMGDLDDGPEQDPLPLGQIEETVAAMLPPGPFDRVLTHGPAGEYTRHRRHEECCQAVVALWQAHRFQTREIWLFDYQDGGRAYFPRVRCDADQRLALPEPIWREKYRIITELYGFGPESWEARTTPREEGFLCFDQPPEAMAHVVARGELSP